MKDEQLQRAPAAGGRESVEPTRQRLVITPRTDIYETADEVVLVAEMPGVDETSIDVTLEADVLTITGRTKDPEHEGYRVAYAEFERGDYQRSFALTGKADPSRIQASIRNGVLRVGVPKAKPAVRKIPVMAGT